MRRAVLEARPDAIIHEATALANMNDYKHFDRTFAQTNRLRTEGTDALLAAAREAGVGRFIAQSFASYRYIRTGSLIKTESDPLDPNPPKAMRVSHAALRHLEKAVVGADGIVLRYGGFYGAANDGLLEPIRKGWFPIVGKGGGITSFVHLDDAAAATVRALDHGKPGIYNIVDDDPAPLSEWLPALANVLDAKPPRHFPVWLTRLVAGDAVVTIATEGRGASNAKAKAELGWTPAIPAGDKDSWQPWRSGQGYRAARTPAGHGRTVRLLDSLGCSGRRLGRT